MLSEPMILDYREIASDDQAFRKNSPQSTQRDRAATDIRMAVGQAKHDDYTVLIIFHFTQTDLQEAEWNFGNR